MGSRNRSRIGSSSSSSGGEWQQPAVSVGNRKPIPPPLEHGWQWQSRPANRRPVQVQPQPQPQYGEDEDDDEEDGDRIEDEDSDASDELLSDEFDSDSSQRSHETLKKSRWFHNFFSRMESLKPEEVNDPERQWHCPACQNGPGSIDWYKGLQPLMTHAKTKGGKRLRLHRILARLLQEELQRRGTSVVPPGESFGRWKGLKDETHKDRLIVWPPMVVVMNTQLEQDDRTNKWVGMGNQELVTYFGDYTPQKARHSYGPQGHRGMSLLVFEASARGYMEAERLHNHFSAQRTDRAAWNAHHRVLFGPGGQRQLYGFLATKPDIDLFNQHSQDKAKLKFEMKSYHETVYNEIRQMTEDNQHLGWMTDKLVKEKRHTKDLENHLHNLSTELHQKIEENRIVMRRTKLQHQETREEMYEQEEFFKEQIKIIHETRDEKEESFEKLQQEERGKVQSSSSKTSKSRNSSTLSKFIDTQNKEMDDYVEQREVLVKAHEEMINAMKKRHWEEEVALEKDLNDKLTLLMDKYHPKASLTKK